MTQYISKSALAAEIERRRKDWRYGSSIEAKYKREECDDILSFLDTLETKDVNLEKEVEDWVKTGPHTSYPWCTIPDAIRITAEHFFELGLEAQKGEVQGHWLVYNHRQKTNERNTIVLLPIVLDILKKYDFRLPHRSNVGYNRQLSILCKEMDLGKNLTTHCARHTFATTVCLGSGIPIQVVQRMLGHSNIHTTEIYTHMTEADLIGGYEMIK